MKYKNEGAYADILKVSKDKWHLSMIESEIESEEVKTEEQPYWNPLDYGLELPEVEEELKITPARPTKLTYTKPNVSIDRI